MHNTLANLPEKGEYSERKKLLGCFITCLLVLSFSLFGCATAREVEDRVEIGITQPTTIYRDQWVVKSPPEVHVQPREKANYAPRVLFVPLRVTQQMDSPSMASHAVSRAIFQTWTTMQLFPQMEYSSDDVPFRRDRALQLGRARGAELVFGGFITYLYTGGTVGDTQVAVQIEALDTTTGQVVWSMAQAGAMPVTKAKDFILFSAKMRVPSDPLHAVSQALANDMGKIIQTWTSGASIRGGFQETDEKVRDTLFKSRDAVAPPRPMSEVEKENNSF